MTQPAVVDASMGLTLDETELEIACRVMAQLAAHPELAHFSFLPAESKGRRLRRALRISALKWLKPGPADNIRDIQASGRDNDKQLISQSGIRLARNQRKRALPAQQGRIMFDDTATVHLPQLLPPLTDRPPVLPQRRVINVDATAGVPSTATSTVTVTASSSTDDVTSTESASTPLSSVSSSSSSEDIAAYQPSVLSGMAGGQRRTPAKGRVKVKRADVDEEKASKDAERKAKRDAENNQGVDLEELKRVAESKRSHGVAIDDEDDDDTSASSPSTTSSTSTANESKESVSSKTSFTGAPEELPVREPVEQIGNDDYKQPSKAPQFGRGSKRTEKVYLRTPIPCYICKKHYTLLHHFYDRMCPPCADLNYEKRSQTADLTLPPLAMPAGTPTPPVRRRIALVTGGRIKIGFDVVLMLVRAGAFVIVTSRFPKDTAHRLAMEPDYAEWRDRIHIYGLDLRVLADVEAFCEHILATYPRLDILINNAAQTIRRPPQYYQHMMALEGTPIAQIAGPLAATLQEFREPVGLRLTADESAKTASLTHDASSTTSSTTNESKYSKDQLDAKAADLSLAPTSAVALRSAAGLSSAQLSQVPLLPEDHIKDDVNFPVNCFDLDGQQIDKRPSQTWVKQLHEVSTVELAEVHIVNALAPFILNSKLKPLMMRSKEGAFIINVSSMEGKFRTFKDVTHPHTNMAKAALNMMTHTVAKDLAHDRIFINSVDTGWVTEELPFPIAQHKRREGFEPPLDEIDGAARILDPIWRSIRDGIHDFGMFFKDYRPADW